MNEKISMLLWDEVVPPQVSVQRIVDCLAFLAVVGLAIFATGHLGNLF